MLNKSVAIIAVHPRSHQASSAGHSIPGFDQAFAEAKAQIYQMPPVVLDTLNKSSSELSRFILALPTMRAMQHTQQQLAERTRHLAMINLKKEPILIKARSQLDRAFKELANLRDADAFRREEQPKSPEMILAELQSAAQASERTTDEMIDAFFLTSPTDHEMELFVKKFLRDRYESIEFRFLAEKFAELYRIQKRKI